MSHLFISMSGPPCRRPSPSLKGAEPTRPVVSSNRAPRLRSTSLFMPGLVVVMGGVLLRSSVAADWLQMVRSQAVGLVNTPRHLVHGDTGGDLNTGEANNTILYVRPMYNFTFKLLRKKHKDNRIGH